VYIVPDSTNYLSVLQFSNMNLYVGNLSPETNADGLRTLFSEFGEVVSTKVIMDPATGGSRGFGFVEMAEKNQSHDAIDNLDQSFFEGNIISVKEAKTNNSQGGGNRGGNSRFGGGGNRGGAGGNRPYRPRTEGGGDYRSNRDGSSGGYRPNRDSSGGGGYRPNRDSSGGGGYRRDNNNGGGYNRDNGGGYNRDNNSYNRDNGGYNRDTNYNSNNNSGSGFGNRNNDLDDFNRL
jgi:cold-inducible RNA-binding protein